MDIKRGIAVSTGVAIGPALVLDTEWFRIPQRFIPPEESDAEVDRLRQKHNISDADANGNSPAPQLEQDVVRQYQLQLISYETQLVKEETQLRKLEELSPDRRRDAIQTSVGLTAN